MKKTVFDTTVLAALFAAFVTTDAHEAIAHEAIERQISAVNIRMSAAPEDAELLLARGRLYLEHGEDKKGLDDLSRATTLEKNLADAWYWRANAEMHLGQFDTARQSNLTFIALLQNTDNTKAMARGYLQCGDIQKSAKKPREAAACYQRAIASGGASPEQYLLYIDSLRSSNQSDAALEATVHALEAHGDLPQLLDAGIAIETGRKNYTAAIQWIDRALQQPNRHEYLLLQKAELQRLQHDETGAQQSLQAALAAINALPAAKRHNQATREIEHRIRQALQKPRE